MTRSPEASVASEAAAWRRCDPGYGRRLWPGCSGRAVACRKSPPVRHSTVHCSSPAWKRRYCTRLSWRRRQSVDCARGAECVNNLLRVDNLIRDNETSGSRTHNMTINRYHLMNYPKKTKRTNYISIGYINNVVIEHTAVTCVCSFPRSGTY